MGIRHTDTREFQASNPIAGGRGRQELFLQLPHGARFRGAWVEVVEQVRGEARLEEQPQLGEQGRVRFLVRWWYQGGRTKGKVAFRVRVEYDVPYCRVLLELPSTGTFLSAEGGGGAGLRADLADGGQNAWFTVIPLDDEFTSSRRFYLLAPTGHYLRALKGGGGAVMADSYLPDEDAVFVMKKVNPSSPQFQRDDRITIYTRIGRTLQRATAEGRPGEPDTMYRVAEIDWLDPRRPLIGLTREDWRFRYFDYGFQSMAVRHDTPLIQFALRRSATQRVARSLGFLDPERTRVATPQSVMRIASVDKPMTRAALEVWMEDANRKVNKQTSFFGYLRERGVQPAGPVSDPRVWEITFAQMISGRSGLDDSSLSNDGASPEEQAREFMRRPLAAQPGTTGHYPNREYELLRFAIHRECGGDSGFITFLRNAVFQHANVFLSTLGANNPNPRECSYVGAIGYPRNRPLLVATTAEALVTLFSRFRVDDGRPLGAGDPLLCAIEVLNSAGMPVERLNCGGPKVLDPNGPAWSEDKQGGGYTAPPVLGGTGMIPAALYESARAGGIDYWFKLPKGSYRTKLYFSEPTATAANERLFHLHINENTVLRRFDIFVAAGGQRRPAVQEFRVEAMGEEGIRIAGTPDPKGLWQDGAHYFGGMNGTVAVVEQNLPGGVVGAAIANQRDDNRMDWMRELLRAAALIDGPYWA